MLEQFGLARYFDHVQGTDGFPAKPAPDVIFKALEGLGATPEECLLVGDAGPTWKRAAAPASRPAPSATATAIPAEMAKWEPDYWIDDLRDLQAASVHTS